MAQNSKVQNFQSNQNNRVPERLQLDLDTKKIIGISAIATVALYLCILPFWNFYLGKLFLQRGWTQPAVVFMASMVITFLVLKYRHLKAEVKALKGIEFPRNLTLNDPTSRFVSDFQRKFVANPSLISNRCIRVMNAYQVTGSREAVSEFAADDAMSFAAASETSFVIPRVLVWAIPLLGFVGTVLGISSAVNGFSGFLQGAEELEQIKAGIGTVTTGLAIAFDTTLLALLLSVCIMIPLVIIERREIQLLQSIESLIYDEIISRIEMSSTGIDEVQLKDSLAQVLEERLPSPEALIEPAQAYVNEAVLAFTQSFREQLEPIHDMVTTALDQAKTVAQSLEGDRQSFATDIEKQRFQNQEMLTHFLADFNQANQQINEQLKINYTELMAGVSAQTDTLSRQLTIAAGILAEKITALEQYSQRTNEIAQLQQTLNETLRSIEETQDLKMMLTLMNDVLSDLKPALIEISKPRRIMLVEDNVAQ